MAKKTEQQKFLDLAKEISTNSTCLKRQYGAIIVKNGIMISEGYNGAAKGCKECSEKCPRMNVESNSGDYRGCPAVHAEMNAVIHGNYTDMIGSDLYLYGSQDGEPIADARPCPICKLLIINAGIKRIITLNEVGTINKGEITWLPRTYDDFKNSECCKKYSDSIKAMTKPSDLNCEKSTKQNESMLNPEVYGGKFHLTARGSKLKILQIIDFLRSMCINSFIIKLDGLHVDDIEFRKNILKTNATYVEDNNGFYIESYPSYKDVFKIHYIIDSSINKSDIAYLDSVTEDNIRNILSKTLLYVDYGLDGLDETVITVNSLLGLHKIIRLSNYSYYIRISKLDIERDDYIINDIISRYCPNVYQTSQYLYISDKHYKQYMIKPQLYTINLNRETCIPEPVKINIKLSDIDREIIKDIKEMEEPKIPEGPGIITDKCHENKGFKYYPDIVKRAILKRYFNKGENNYGN